MVHGVQELVLVNKAPKDEVDQSKKSHQLRSGENAVHYAYDEDEQCLRQGVSVAKHGWLNQLGKVCNLG